MCACVRECVCVCESLYVNGVCVRACVNVCVCVCVCMCECVHRVYKIIACFPATVEDGDARDTN